MAKKIIIGIILALIIISAVVLISAVTYTYSVANSGNNDRVQINVEKNNNQDYNAPMYSTQNTVTRGGCYEEVIQVKDSGECIGGIPQEKKQCYRHVITCSGQRTESISCYDEVPQVKGDGECIGVSQEKRNCYKQVETCSGMRTETIQCYEGIEQEKGYGECMGISQEKGQCYKVNDYSKCY